MMPERTDGAHVDTSRMSAVDMEVLQRWIGRTETRCDVLSAAPVAALSASLDYEHPRALIGDSLPPCWHWLYFQDAVAASGLGIDGHARRGRFPATGVFTASHVGRQPSAFCHSIESG